MARFVCYILDGNGNRLGKPVILKARNAEVATGKVDRYLHTHPEVAAVEMRPDDPDDGSVFICSRRAASVE